MKLNLKTMMIAGAVAGAMVLEAVVLLMMMPSQTKPAQGGDDQAAALAAKDEFTPGDTAEEPIDEFKCTNNLEESNLHLRFKVVAVVKDSEKVSFRDAVASRKARVRQSVEKILRRAGREELNDPDLNTIKRLIREEVNKVLEKSYVSEAVIHDYSIVEQ